MLQAAVDVFGKYGAAGTMDQVAALADVGKGTIYRQFPTRESLLEAAAIVQLEKLREIGAAAVQAPAPPAQALAGYVRALLRMRHQGTLIISLFTTDLPPEARRMREQSRVPLRTLLERAAAAGVTREDVQPEDVFFLLSASAAHLTALETRSVREWDRAAYLLLCAIGVDPALAHDVCGVQQVKFKA